ncbi:AI-2E family transporter [Robertmurraya sp. DFI.2.37]|uniref:AI-2E family transporter n=1 Tax=Robertmurraya sp. DFI.2.37 TaxID=3031819 RepID=UPI0012458803|nr:AI-2E family transporter [Robertmurraya sp. DFI.2.37]MDF1510655.1 AI-2E family transporter [Robertmurraya sp. DFI.2.37]
MDNRLRWIYRFTFLLLLFVLIYVFFKLKPVWLPFIDMVAVIFTPFIISAFITYLLHPIVEKLHENYFPRWLSILIIYLLFFGGIAFAIYKGLPAFILQLRDLVDSAPEFANQYRSWVILIQEQTSAWPEGFQERVDEGIIAAEQAVDRMLTKLLDYLVGILNSMIMIALIPFITFYMLKDVDLIKKAAWYLTPRKWRKKGVQFLKDVDESLGGYIRGQILVGASVGTIAAFLFWFVDMKYPLLLGVIVGITNIIPYFGPIIALVPITIIAATMSMKMVITSVIIVVILQFLEGNILSPLIVGKSLHMHPLLIMLALFAGGEMGGIIGLILGVPILAILKVILLHSRNHFVQTRLKG